MTLSLWAPAARPARKVSGAPNRVQTQKNPPGGGLQVARFGRENLVCAQLHPPGSCRMMMVAHVVDANEHDERGYRGRCGEVNNSSIF
jgi:hypothetical protein